MRKGKNFENENDVIRVVNKWLDRNDQMSLRQIAMDLGLASASSFFTQVRSGRTKFPIALAKPFAELIGEDPAELVTAIMRVYYPEMLEVLVECQLINLDSHPGLTKRPENKQRELLAG